MFIRFFYRPALKVSNNKILANKILQEAKTAFEKTDFSLRNTMLKTVQEVSDTINGVKIAGTDTVKNAGLLDDAKQGNPMIKTLLEMGVKYNSADIEFIRATGNKSAAELLEAQLLNQAKPKI